MYLSIVSLYSPSAADSYLLQVQEYSGTPSPNAKQPGENEATPNSTPEPRWHDVDIMKATQHTVTAYQVPVEENGQGKVSLGRVMWSWVPRPCSCSCRSRTSRV